MLKKPHCPVIAIEEHYWDEERAKTYSGVESPRRDEQLKRLYDLGDLRIKDMDEAGVDIQIISHGAPSAQKLSGDDAVPLVQRVNDRLAAAGGKHPSRAAASAAPPAAPAARAREVMYFEKKKNPKKAFPMVIRAAWGFTVETATI